MEGIKKVQAVAVAVIAAITGWLGNLAMPVFVLLACNVIDYVTGIMAAPKRGEKVSSYKGIEGIAKKICQYMLVIVGWLIDVWITYAVQYVRPDFREPYVVAIVVALWLVLNEMISILENLKDIGVPIPPFLLPLVSKLKKKTEEVAKDDAGYSEGGSGDSDNGTAGRMG